MRLGCVLHLLEDMGVPAHVRNDFLFAHYRNVVDHGNPLEGWVERRRGDDWAGPEIEGGQIPVNRNVTTKKAAKFMKLH